jgi:hypothetical protein
LEFFEVVVVVVVFLTVFVFVFDDPDPDADPRNDIMNFQTKNDPSPPREAPTQYTAICSNTVIPVHPYKIEDAKAGLNNPPCITREVKTAALMTGVSIDVVINRAKMRHSNENVNA